MNPSFESPLDPFPPGPALERWLFEQPIPTMLALVALGLLGAFLLRQTPKAKWAPAPILGALVLATGAWSLATMVTTDRERIAGGTRAFVDAMVEGDRARVRAQIDKDITLAASGSQHLTDGDELASLAPRVPQFVSSYNLRDVSTTLDGERVGRTRFEITLGVGRGQPMPMGWELHWRELGGSWRIVRAECKHVWNRPPARQFETWISALRP